MMSDAAGSPAHAAPDKSKVFLPLFLRNERRVYSYILMLLPNRADADDVLQDVSLVMWDKFDADDPPANFAAWGCQIAYFKVLDFYKKGRRAKVRFSQEMFERVAALAESQADALRLDDRREALAGCIEKLPAADRALLTRRFADGGSVQSAARDTGRSVEAAYKALAKTRHVLLDCVQRTMAREGRP